MLLHISRVILIIFEVLILFNLLIVVHELGHFLAARWRGLFIEQFGIWFGKPLWKKKINGVLYSLGSIPAGGFVKLPQLAPMDIIEGKADLDREKLPPISAVDKIIVAFAGPLFSFGLAIAFAIFVSVVGRPVSESESTTTITVAREVGGKTETMTVQAKPIVPPTKAWMRKALRQIEIVPAETPLVAKVEPDSPAAKAGLQPNDLIVAVNGRRLYNILEIRDFI